MRHPLWPGSAPCRCTCTLIRVRVRVRVGVRARARFRAMASARAMVRVWVGLHTVWEWLGHGWVRVPYMVRFRFLIVTGGHNGVMCVL